MPQSPQTHRTYVPSHLRPVDHAAQCADIPLVQTPAPTPSPTASPTPGPTPACHPGSLRGRSGECAACPGGKYTTSYNALQCTACAAGQFTLPGAAGCTDCAVGRYHPSSGSTCHACSAGKYSVWTSGQSRSNPLTNCWHCPSGKFQDKLEYHVCHECPLGGWTEGLAGWGHCAQIPTAAPTAAPTSPTAAPTHAPTAAATPPPTTQAPTAAPTPQCTST